MGLYNTAWIYCIENIYTHKKYIGYTRNCFGDRFDNHLNQLRHNIHKSTEMQNDYNIYGEDSFVFSVIENIDKNTSNPEEFYDKEKYYISLYNTVENGYNTSTGGRGGATGIPLSDEHIQKIAEINRKRLTNSHLSEETRKKISQSNTGKIMSEEAKEKIRQANTGKTRTKEQKMAQSKRVPNKRISDELAHYIKQLIAEDVKPKDISAQTGVSISIINDIKRGRSYKFA